jgi:DedD protein
MSDAVESVFPAWPQDSRAGREEIDSRLGVTFQPNEVILMDSQLRTRLIGAAVLIGLAVIFVPMLLDKGSVPAPGTEEIPLEIPAQNSEGMQTRTLPINPEAPMVEIDATAPDPIARVDTARAAAPVRRLASETDVAPQRAASNQSEGAIERAPAPVASVAPAAPRPVTPAPAPAPAATPVPRPNTAVTVSQSAGGRFGVNFGSYGALANAEKLITQLAAVKVKASVEPVTVSGKALFRVAARGFASRSAAEAARLSATTSIDGLNASILQGELASDAAPATQVAPSLQSFAVQIGVYGDKIKADELINSLKAKGFAAFGERVITPGGATVRVRVGPILKRVDADKAKTAIKAKLGLDGIVVPYP